jgi:putative endonuclease
VEVKTRETDEFGTPDKAVNEEKQRHIIRAAGAFLRAAGCGWDQSRFDIVSVLGGDAARIQHIRDAFRPAQR